MIAGVAVTLTVKLLLRLPAPGLTAATMQAFPERCATACRSARRSDLGVSRDAALHSRRPPVNLLGALLKPSGGLFDECETKPSRGLGKAGCAVRGRYHPGASCR